MITGIVLAAGTSSRFGRTKQLLELDHKPLVQHAVDAAANGGLDEVVVVLGHDAATVETALQGARTVFNPAFAQGQSTSLIAGLDAANPESEAAVVLLADQPGITPDHVRTLVEAFRARRSRIVRLRFRNGPGPALLSRDVWDEARKLTGDAGAREIIGANPKWVEDIAVDEDAPPDVDEAADLDRLR